MIRFSVLLPFLWLCLFACTKGRDEAAIPSVTISDHPSLIIEETATTVSCRLPDGGAVRLPKQPRRTAILLTSLLDLWVESGGTVAARCHGTINVPPEVLDAPVVGTFSNVNVEKLIALQPDLVIASDVGDFRAVVPILEENRIAYVYLRYINYYDYTNILELFAKLNGTEERFQATRDAMAARVNAISAKYRALSGPKVLIVFATSNSINCELPNSQTGVMLELLGAHNVIPAKYQNDANTRVDFSLERIVQLDPDVVLLNTMGDVDECRTRLEKEFASNAAWRSLRAIREGRFHVLPKHYFLYKANDDFPDALQYLAGLLYERDAAEPGQATVGGTASSSGVKTD